jgi:hypothetical protein
MMGFEPMMRVLQTLALPLGNVAAEQIICNSGRLRQGRWNSLVEAQQNIKVLSIIGSSDSTDGVWVQAHAMSLHLVGNVWASEYFAAEKNVTMQSKFGDTIDIGSRHYIEASRNKTPRLSNGLFAVWSKSARINQKWGAGRGQRATVHSPRPPYPDQVLPKQWAVGSNSITRSNQTSEVDLASEVFVALQLCAAPIRRIIPQIQGRLAHCLRNAKSL